MSFQEPFLLHSPFLLCISIGLLLLFRVVVSQIPLGSKLSVVENDFWFSSNGDFALGFFNSSDQPNQFSVGIRYNSKLITAAKQTVVWVAGGDATVGNQSYFQLSQNGELVLFDSSKGFTVWTTKTRLLSVASAFLQDDGNFVLLNERKDVVWQSFDTPSNTLLPGQKLYVFSTLRPATTDPLSSSYSLYMNSLGQLLLRWDSIAYWKSGRPSHLNLSAVLTSNGTFQLMDQNLEPVWSAFGEDHGDSVKFRFLRLDADGNLRLYSWVKASRSWRSVWQAVENQCSVFATCGEQGICLFNASASPVCKCPFKSTSSASTKCLFPRSQECDSGADLVEYEHMLLYGIYPANDSIFQSSLRQCKLACIHDPQCSAVTFTNDGTAQCRMMTTQYVSGYSDPWLSSVSFTRKCLYTDPLAAKPNFTKSPPSFRLVQSNRLCIPCQIGAGSGTVVVFIVIQFGIGIFLYRRRKSIRRRAALAFTGPNSKGLLMLSFSEIKELSANFKYQLGPKMFKGMRADNQPIAIKKMDATIAERKFRSAVSKIGNIHHKNLVKLEGYCCELNHKYLVYEFAKNGSLEKYIQDSKFCGKLNWRKRVDICLSVARALFYLHTECREFVSHGNLKCGNVVLDEDFEAKVTDFGLGIFHGGASFNWVPAAKDVEDFGKMVLMLVSGRYQEVEENVCEWAYKEWMEGNAERIVDQRIDSEVDPQKLERMLRLVFWCLQTDEHMRPSMGEVVMVLEGTSTVDPPPPPFACRRPLDDEESSESALEN
ncbi:G-type lectin S-receptor-like serine/threonine-protein kinase SD3-1 isoform X2 [Mangifera indica]|uniref:G-type lectin S-receptor-like serine/threonine-protein kinase SD3-1 isoform X2 n=1 Tax=Mangifera indica TaxID=29780 RepID=UPI001CF98661|nr:G-type lectin S-receptor-like serine/threonine-protein kinase SD3-1 isoform X2 [Mangifera indica]